MFVKKTLAHKIRILGIAGILLYVLVSTAVIAPYVLKQYSASVLEKDRIILKGLAGFMEQFLGRAHMLNRSLSMHPEVIRNVLEAPENLTERSRIYNDKYNVNIPCGEGSGFPLFVELQLRYPFVELLYVQDINGDQTARSHHPLGPRGRRWYFQRILQDPEHRPFVTKSYYSVTSEEPTAAVIHPVEHEGRLIGVMGADINFGALQQAIDAFLEVSDLQAMMVDQVGTVIAHCDRQRVAEMYNYLEMKKYILLRDEQGQTYLDEQGYHASRAEDIEGPPELAECIRAAVRGESCFRSGIRLDGRLCTVYYEPVLLPGRRSVPEHYAVVLVRDHSTLAATRRMAMLLVAGIAGLVGLALHAGVGWLFRRQIYRPLSRLSAAMEQTEMGRPVKADIRTGDEFEALADTYNRMQQRLQEVTAALQQSEEAYRSLYENVPVGILRIGLNGAGPVMQANPTAARIFGFENSDRMMNQDMEPLCTDREEYREYVRRVLQHGAEGSCELRMKTQKGGMIWVSLTMKVRRAGSGAPQWVDAVLEDITRRKEAEENLKEHQAGLEKNIEERTEDLTRLVNAMAGREVKMAELKAEIRDLREKLQDAGMD